MIFYNEIQVLVHLSNTWINVISRFASDISRNRPNSPIPGVLLHSIGLYHFLLFSVALKLAQGHEVHGN